MANEAPTIKWTGRSGKQYTYHVYPLEDLGSLNFKPMAGNYIFAKRTGAGGYTAVYIGQTGDLSERFAYHHKLDCIHRRGATHLHARLNSGGEDARCAEERDLVDRHDPPCNG